MDKKYLAIGLGSVAIIGGLAYYLNKNKQTSNISNTSDLKKSLPYNSDGLVELNKLNDKNLKELYIQLLKQQLKEFQPLVEELEQLSKILKFNSIQKGQDPKPEDIQMILLSDQNITKKMNELEDKVYQDFKIDKKSLTEIVNKKLKEDEEANRILNKTSNLINEAAKGTNLAKITDIPKQLTPQKAFELTQECLKVSNVQLQKVLMDIQIKNGKVDYDSDETKQEINKIDISSAREDLFKREGLVDLEDPASRVLRAAMYKYMTMMPEFEKEVQKLEEVHQICYSQIVQQPEKIIDFQKVYKLQFPPEQI